jgi:hypothetical protein
MKTQRYRVYVVELRPLREERWTSVYVGSSALPPAERFRHHMGVGDRRAASGIVRRRGVRLRPDLYGRLPAFPSRAEARTAERALRDRLRRRGFRVYGR